MGNEYKDDVEKAMAELNGEEVPEEKVEEEPAQEASEEIPAEDETSQEEAPEEEPSAEEEEATVEAPEHYSVEDKETFNAIPNEHRAMLLDARKSLERGYDEKFQGQAREREENKQLADLMAPFEQQLNAAGMDRIGGIRMLVGAQQLLQTDPIRGMSQLAQQYSQGNPRGLLTAMAQAMGVQLTPPADAEVDSYTDPEIAALKEQNARILNHLGQQQTNSQQQSLSDAEQQIRLFAEAKDDAGNPKYPHLETLRPAMGGLMQAGMAADIETAYEMASRANPQIFEGMMKAERERVVTDLDSERKKANKKAKEGSRDVKTRHAAPETPNETPQKVQDCVEQAWEQASNN